jgi:hexosaminidase
LKQDFGVWPHPQSISSNTEFYSINAIKFQFISKAAEKCEILEKSIARYEKKTFIEDCSLLGPKGKIANFKIKQVFNVSNYGGMISYVTIEMKTCEQLPHMNMNENYTIIVDKNGAVIRSDTNWGAIRGLETFSQLVRQVGVNQFIINQTSIEDYPRFSHRGIMLDTSRHYIPIEILFDNLDAMAYNKLNVFHWHIVDDQSFPYVSKKFPDLSTKGAYNSETHIYTPTDVKNIIEYARERGIRVLVEFDSPGHTQSWGKGQQGLLTECYTDEKLNGLYGPIDPTKNSSYSFIKDLFTEISQTFPDQYLHLGGDEVRFKCWQSNPDITKFMVQNHMDNNYVKLEEYYMQNVLDIIRGLNKSYIVWEEVFNNGVHIKPDTVVHVWKGTGPNDAHIWINELDNVTKNGFNALLSSCWYLNHLAYGADWEEYYICDPHSFRGTDQQNKLVLGGEACLWAEFVDGSNLMSRLW